MRIIGGHDYYDKAIAYGIDPGVVFVRDSKYIKNSDMEIIGEPTTPSITLSEPKSPSASKWSHPTLISTWNGKGNGTLNGVNYGITGHSVIFCGKSYGGIELRDHKNHQTYFFWKYDKLKKWADERGLTCSRSYSWWERKDPNSSEEFIVLPKNTASLQRMIDLNISILMLKPKSSFSYRNVSNAHRKDRIEWLEQESDWQANCCGLAELGFQSALDPYTAFQELSMWVGGTLSANGPNTVTITDDKIKVAKHGFDKHSFRKDKQT